MKAEGRQKNRTKLFLPSSFTPSSDPLSTIFTTSNGPIPYPPLTFSAHQGKENSNHFSHEHHRKSQRNKNKINQNLKKKKGQQQTGWKN